MIEKYLWVSSEESFYQVLSNFIGVTDHLQKINKQKTWQLRGLAMMLLIQVACIAVVAILAQSA